VALSIVVVVILEWEWHGPGCGRRKNKTSSYSKRRERGRCESSAERVWVISSVHISPSSCQLVQQHVEASNLCKLLLACLKPGNVGEFHIGQGKGMEIRKSQEIVVCLRMLLQLQSQNLTW